MTNEIFTQYKYFRLQTTTETIQAFVKIFTLNYEVSYTL